MSTITIEIPNHIEQKLQLLAVSSRKEIAEIILDLIEKELSASEPTAPAPAQAEDPKAWVERFRAWVESQSPRGGKADWSRESIYD